ncbi:MAG: tRNA epoxyqueuosine(34) reductase QueG [Melioribacteraceae bacterium]|nr:tRNA epoxyqueuosine(34) reductase QueG [Melioribacteraceae bacterium]
MALTNNDVMNAASRLGFDLVGFSKAEKLEKQTNDLTAWLKKNYHAGMKYMERNIDKRNDVSNILDGAKSVISLALNYYYPSQNSISDGKGKVSRYAWGKDYHFVLWDKLDLLEKELKQLDPNFECKSYVDTGPLMDKAWAVKSGIGWLGKHSNVISRTHGSWFFIATIITNCEFEYGAELDDFCGDCTACIDACPTEAIVEDYVVDSNKCISYLTIENKDEIPVEFKSKFDGWIFGCDVCQDVCPWNNKFALISNETEFRTDRNRELDLNSIAEMTNSQFKEEFRFSPINRAKLTGIKRNAKFLEK